MKHIKNFTKVFEDEIESLKFVLKNIDLNNIKNIIEKILTLKGKLIVSGIGKSGHIGKKIAATFASTGTKSFYLHSTEAFHGDLGTISSDDVILLISYSGETDEVLKILNFCNENSVISISITGDHNSTLAKHSDFHICCNVLREACSLNLAPTSSTTATLLIGDALAVCLMKAKNFKEIDFARYHPGGSLGKRLLTNVGDVMKKNNLPIINKSMDIFDIIFTISNCGYGIAFLVENEKLIGLLTDGDIRRSINNNNQNLNINIYSLVNKKFTYAKLDYSLEQIKNIMKKKKVLTLPVLNKNSKLLGLIQYYDI